MIVGAGAALVGAIILGLSGLPGVAASSHFSAAGEWFRHLMVRQSVTLRSIATKAPVLDDVAMIQRGAGHYELVCAACHGSPAQPPAAFARGLSPRPPQLVAQMDHWRPASRIFWTVKHGIRQSAMPAWPDLLRDDEVWDMVAFLRAMPGMSEPRYRLLSGKGESAACVQCHGAGGEGGGARQPRLDIQSPQYVADALRAFRSGTRSSGTMRTVAAGLDDAEIADLAARFGKEVKVAGGRDDEGPGAEIALRGIPDRKVPACQGCHGAVARADYPRLEGQDAAYLAHQLRLFASLGERRGGPYAHVMATAVRGLSEDEISAVAHWYAARTATRPEDLDHP